MTDEPNSQRQFIRHPSDIPITWSFADVAVKGTEYLRNISEGGLAFLSVSEIAEGVLVDINIPVVHPQVSMKGVVVWCRPESEGRFEVGVRFVDESNRFRMRMVEQICHIEIFKKEIQEKEGRTVSGEEAALEWIHRFAKDFPK
jgi:Tfp pilus assembly protein PilZ